jgi:hypothetical protein
VPPAGAAGGVDLRPALYVLAVGVSKYQDPAIQLEFAAKDSTDLSNFFKTQEGGLYRKVSVRLLTDGGARRDDVLDGLEWIRRELTARDVAMVFIAGHGVNDADGTYYFLPQDVNIKALKRTGVIFSEIRNTLVSLPGKAMFFIDTCHAGNVLGTGTRSLRLDTTAVINELSSADNGVIVFAAATGRQYAQESSDWGNGAFHQGHPRGFAREGRLQQVWSHHAQDARPLCLGTCQGADRRRAIASDHRPQRRTRLPARPRPTLGGEEAQRALPDQARPLAPAPSGPGQRGLTALAKDRDTLFLLYLWILAADRFVRIIRRL